MRNHSDKRQDTAAPTDMVHDFINKMHRRTFLKLTGAAVAAASVPSIFMRARPAYAAGVPKISRSGVPDIVETDTKKIKFVYSVCLQCHSACGIRGKVDIAANRLLTIQGNPFHPNSRDDEDGRPTMGAKKITDLAVLKDSGTLCPKAVAGVEIIYNPYRILSPLKRVGARGAGKWVSITYEQAFKEIAAKMLPYWTRGPDPTFTGDKTQFLIDKDNPKLGYRNNQVAFMVGRLEHGQKEFSDRWFGNGFGSVNKRLDHTSTCETNHHVAIGLAFNNKKDHTKPDVLSAKFILFLGANVFEANFPQQTLSRKMARAIKDNKLEVAIADPRFSKLAAKAKYWLPVIPNTDAAVCFAIAHRWFDKTANFEAMTGGAIDTEYLKQATRGAAEAAGQISNSDATWLVRRDNGEYYRDSKGSLYVWFGGKAVAVGAAPHKNTAKVTGTLMTGTIGVDAGGGVICDTAFTLIYNTVTEHTIDEWAQMCGVPANKLIAVADAMAKYGKQACVDFYRGPVMVTNGTRKGLAIVMLNTLRGNYDHKGGVATGGGGHWHEMGGKVAGQFGLKAVPNGYKAVGPRIDRATADFADYKGKNEAFPKRPWFPLAKHGVWQEVIPSIGDAYPYSVKVLFAYWANPLHTTPGARYSAAPILKDEQKLPLFVAFDNDFGETAVLADYIIPDTTYLERWSTPHTAPVNLMTFSGFRQPMVGGYKNPNKPRYDEFEATVGSCRQFEDIWIGLGLELAKQGGRAFPGIGKGGFGSGKDVYSAWDWYDKVLDNLRLEHNAKTGMKITKQDIVDHGGAFTPTAPVHEKVNGAEVLKHRLGFGETVRLYCEAIAKTVDYMVGKPGTSTFKGTPLHDAVRDINNDLIEDDPQLWPFVCVTYKQVQHKQTVTTVCPTLMSLAPENFVEMNAADARDLGLQTGDRVLVTSPSNAAGEIGKVRLTETIRPGVVAVAMSFGRWETSSRSHLLDGKATGFDPRRGAGVCLNPVRRLDPVLKNVSLQDKIGGGCSYSETRIRITKLA